MQARDLYCRSCNVKYEKFQSPAIKSILSPQGQFSIWPSVNPLFEEGMKMVVESSNITCSTRNLIFVDFSIYYIQLLLDSNWLFLLSRSNMAIVLVADSIMMPLASYYSRNENKISDVINVSDGIGCIIHSVRKLFVAQPLVRKYVRSFTTREKEILRLMLNNKLCVKEISEMLFLPPRDVYNAKQRIESKLGMSIRRLLQIS